MSNFWRWNQENHHIPLLATRQMWAVPQHPHLLPHTSVLPQQPGQGGISVFAQKKASNYPATPPHTTSHASKVSKTPKSIKYQVPQILAAQEGGIVWAAGILLPGQQNWAAVGHKLLLDHHDIHTSFFALLPCFSRPSICLRPLIIVLFPRIFNVISCQGFTPIFICLFIFTQVLTQVVSFPSNSNWHLVFHLPEPSSVAAPRLIWLETYRQQTFTFSTSNIIWDLNPQHWRCREIDI